MKTNLNFNSAVCTSREQSERLLTLGLKKETADCILVKNAFLKDSYLTFPIADIDETLENEMCDEPIPAWSLHRLIEMCNKTQFGMTIGIYRDEVTVDGDLFEVYDNTYDNLISIIEWLIGLDKFNKDYLNE